MKSFSALIASLYLCCDSQLYRFLLLNFHNMFIMLGPHLETFNGVVGGYKAQM